MKINHKRDDDELMFETRTRMGEHYTANQVLGRTQTIGCVAVEITQRCNLDCTLCYLSEHSQSVHDIPIEEVFRRLDDIIIHYGVGTHVQITGGDPTLRKHTELISIVRYAADIGLYPALFTNGIAATRTLLENLATVGLQDVAFHVDTTQRRAGFDTEMDLNVIRKEYLARASGLDLMVVFNITVHEGNFSHIPNLVRFFVEHSNEVGLVSFQLQAETGRGEWGSRDGLITQQSMKRQIEKGTSSPLPWGVIDFGHGDCHSYMPTVVVNNRVFPVIADRELFGRFLKDFQHIRTDRHARRYRLLMDYSLALLKRPWWWWPAINYATDMVWKMGRNVFLGRGQVHKLSFFMQNFMDATQIEQERVDACSFMVMTSQGPVSMCEHNAKRDDYILQPLQVNKQDGTIEQYVAIPDIKKFRKVSGSN